MFIFVLEDEQPQNIPSVSFYSELCSQFCVTAMVPFTQQINHYCVTVGVLSP